MTPPHRTVLTFEYATAERARRVARSLRPEVGAIDGDRTTARLARDGATLECVVEASDLVALRAGCNTWLTLTGVAETAGDC
ncbi:KEOPS complex Pcc1-like subunit [Halomicroarcula limicola]|uniref:KEOPS complex Pcc1-like subunit n=1 Tax=Haloarcula limicola TaxID=1429915 RepID=A0A8J7YAQ2_9EURY|nr:KEOPS complex subunit Pcc1 [Halomicroarcula limicola]MBV0923766.1 KEOPS complex Pcc1-like subunit [Halomicroarcula limicola]